MAMLCQSTEEDGSFTTARATFWTAVMQLQPMAKITRRAREDCGDVGDALAQHKRSESQAIRTKVHNCRDGSVQAHCASISGLPCEGLCLMDKGD